MNADGERQRHITERTYEYALRAVRLFSALERKGHGAEYILGKQFLRSATSIGANVQEAQSAESRADFVHKLTIAQKEARESLYWLRLLRDGGFLRESQLASMLKETEEIIAILTAILVSSKSKRPALSTIHNS